MRSVGVYNSGGAVRSRLQEQMRRLFNSYVQLVYQDEHGEASVNSLVADRTEFWWNPKRPDDRTLWESKIELGEKFFEEVIRHPVPLDLNILKTMKRSSLGLDLYMWRHLPDVRAHAPAPFSRGRSSTGSSARTQPRWALRRTVDSFRTKCLRMLEKIQRAWPDLYGQGRTRGLAVSAAHRAVTAPSR